MCSSPLPSRCHFPRVRVCRAASNAPRLGSIVFVHGLQGDGELTWTHPKYGVYWPQDLLPLDVKNARILSWHYDSRVTGFWTETTTNDIDSYASNLCGDLTQLRGETSSVSSEASPDLLRADGFKTRPTGRSSSSPIVSVVSFAQT